MPQDYPDSQHTTDRPSETVGATIGHYRLLEQIGEGGMGVVFMAEQQKPVRRKVALKIIKPGMDTKHVIARFEAERQALAMMDHPNIARVLDAGTTDSKLPYFVMELVRGIPITDYCDQNKLTTSERLELFVVACQAVQHAHTKGIIHRDIKPSNVLVTLHDGVPIPKIIDFGLARATNQQLTDKTLFTAFAQMVGTPIYMSPEQAEMSSLDIDTRSDIYSLGVMLYELLTGSTPLDRKRMKTAAYDEIRRIIREEEPAKPSTKVSTVGDDSTTVAAKRKTDVNKLRQRLRGELDWIVLKSLEKDRTRRYQTANDFAADVRRHLSGETVEACPPTFKYRMLKLVRRYRAEATLAATVLTMLLLSSVVAWALFINARAARDREATAKLEARAAEAEALSAKNEAEEQRSVAERSQTLAEERSRENATIAEQLRRQLYQFNISKAVQAYASNDVFSARNFLNNCVPEQRDWEWNYLWAKSGIDRTLELPVTRILHMTPSPVEDIVAIVDAENHLGVYRLADGSPIWSQDLQMPHAFKPMFSSDGRLIEVVTHYAVQGGLASVYDAASGERRWHQAHAEDEISSGIIFNPQNSRLAIVPRFSYGKFKGYVEYWNFDETEPIWSRPCDGYPMVRISPEGDRIYVSATTGGQPTSGSFLECWDLEDAEPIWRHERKNSTSNLLVSPQGDRLITGGANHFEVRDADTGIITVSFNGEGFFVGFNSPSEEHYMSIFGNETRVRSWQDHSTVQFIRSFTHGLADAFGDTRFLPDGQRFITTAGSSNRIDFHRAIPPISPLVLKTHQGWFVSSICFSADGTKLYSLQDGVLSCCSTRTGRLLQKKRVGDRSSVVALSPDGQLVATGGDQLRIWRTDGWELLHEWEEPQWWIRFSADGKRIISGGNNGDLVARELASGRTIRTQPTRGLTDGLVLLDDSGERVAVLAQDQSRLELWNVDSGSFEPLFSRDGFTPCRGLAWSPQLGLIAAGIGNQIELWKPNDRSLVRSLAGHLGNVACVEFDAEGRRIFSQDYAGGIKIWDAETGEELFDLAQVDAGSRNHSGEFAVSPDGTTLAAGVRDGKVNLWESVRPTTETDRHRRIVLVANEEVEKLFANSLPLAEVLTSLANNTELSPDVRSAAIDLANVRGEQAAQ